MEPSESTAAGKGKGKAQEPFNKLQTPSYRRLNTPTYIGHILSPPTSPIQGARLPMNKRFPVRPAAASSPSSPSSPAADSNTSSTSSAKSRQVLAPFAQQLLPALEPLQIVKTTGSTDSIAESMTKEFKYDPNEKTPPQRRMQAVADAVKSAVNGNAGPSSTNTSKSQTFARPAVQESRLQVEQQRTQRQPNQAIVQACLDKGEGEGSKLARLPAAPPGLYMSAFATRLIDMAANLTHNQATSKVLHDDVDIVYDRNTLTTGNLLRTGGKHSGEEDSDGDVSDDGPAAFFLRSDAQRRIDENRRLTVLSEHTEPWSGREDENWTLAGSSSKFRMKQPNLSFLNIVEPGVWMGQTAKRNSVYSTAPQPQNSSGDGDRIGEAGPSRIAAGSFFPSVSLKSRPRSEGNSFTELDEASVLDANSLYQHPSATVVNPDLLPHPLPTSPAPTVTRGGSGSPVHLSPIKEEDPSGGLLSTSSDTSPSVPVYIENEKSPSVSPPTGSASSMSSSSTGWMSKCCSTVWYILVWMILLAFLAAALNNMATTRTFDEMLHDLFNAESKTHHSENGSSNLTMAWMNGHAVWFNVSAIVNTTLNASEAGPHDCSFLFDWRADSEMLSADKRTVNQKASAMALPSFGEEFLRSMGYLGLYAAIFWFLRLLSSSVSRCWHWREDENVSWTRDLLRRFDEGKAMG